MDSTNHGGVARPTDTEIAESLRITVAIFKASHGSFEYHETLKNVADILLRASQLPKPVPTKDSDNERPTLGTTSAH